MDSYDIENIDWGSARSFPGLIPPNEAEEIARKKYGDNTYIFYRDSEGNLWYNTTKGIAFEFEMKERDKVRNITKRMA